MKIIKRSGSEDIFDISKIEAAIRKANDSVIVMKSLETTRFRRFFPMLRKPARI